MNPDDGPMRAGLGRRNSRFFGTTQITPHTMEVVKLMIAMRLGNSCSIAFTCWLALSHLMSSLQGAVVPETVYLYDLDQGSSAKRSLMASLSGIVARTTAEVAMGFQSSNSNSDPEFWVDRFIDDHAGTNKVWQGNVEWFIDRYKSQLNGYVVYDAASVNQGTSVAGAMGAIMVDQSLLGTSVGAALNNAGLGQVADVRGRDSLWVYNNYGSLFNKDAIFRQQPQFSYQLRSLAVKEAGFVFNETGSLRDQYLAGQNDHSLVYGWGYDNSETEFFGSASEHNLMGVPADHLQSAAAPSAWEAQLPLQAKHTAMNAPTQAEKHYVAFVMSDGDNVQWLTNDFARDSRWFGSPYRGDFDFTFDMSPALRNVNPTALKYFYDAAAEDEHKTFFVAAGGEGLNYPSQVPDIEGFMDASTAAMLEVDQNIISVLDDSPDLNVLNAMVERPEVMGLMLKTGQAYAGHNGAIYWHQGKPIASVKHTLWDGFDTPNSIIADLNNAPHDPFNDLGSYTIVNVHPWSTSLAGGGTGSPMGNVNHIVQNLNNSVEVVTLEELFIHLRNNFGDEVDPGKKRNLIANGDFEQLDPGNASQPLSWFSGGQTSLVSGQDSDESGQRAVRISGPNSDWRSVDFNSEAGDEYTFTFDFKFDQLVPDGSGFRADTRFFTLPEESGGTFVGESTSFIDASAYDPNIWHSMTVNVVVPANATVGDVRFSTFFGAFTNGSVLIDNVRMLTEVIPGDFNLDGLVNGLDLTIWQSSYGLNALADADGDGDSDGADFMLWQRNFSAGSLVANSVVPEPVLGLNFFLLFLFFRRQHDVGNQNRALPRLYDSILG